MQEPLADGIHWGELSCSQNMVPAVNWALPISGFEGVSQLLACRVNTELFKGRGRLLHSALTTGEHEFFTLPAQLGHVEVDQELNLQVSCGTGIFSSPFAVACAERGKSTPWVQIEAMKISDR